MDRIFSRCEMESKSRSLLSPHEIVQFVCHSIKSSTDCSDLILLQIIDSAAQIASVGNELGKELLEQSDSVHNEFSENRHDHEQGHYHGDCCRSDNLYGSMSHLIHCAFHGERQYIHSGYIPDASPESAIGPIKIQEFCRSIVMLSMAPETCRFHTNRNHSDKEALIFMIRDQALPVS
jgi:hypothetical protein